MNLLGLKSRWFRRVSESVVATEHGCTDQGTAGERAHSIPITQLLGSTATSLTPSPGTVSSEWWDDKAWLWGSLPRL